MRLLVKASLGKFFALDIKTTRRSTRSATCDVECGPAYAYRFFLRHWNVDTHALVVSVRSEHRDTFIEKKK
jgi:hypothetical protein